MKNFEKVFSFSTYVHEILRGGSSPQPYRCLRRYLQDSLQILLSKS